MATNSTNATKERNDVNSVILRGVIVYKFRRDNWLLLTIACGNTEDTRNYPKVYWYDEAANEAEKYDVGDRVEIEAKLQTSRQYKKPSIVGLSIKTTPKELETKFGVTHNKGKYLDDKNEIRLRGKFVRSFTPESVDGQLSIITIRTQVDNHTYFPQVTCFRRQLAKLADIEEGDDVCVLAHVQTRKSERNNEPVYYQTIVAHYLFDNDHDF